MYSPTVSNAKIDVQSSHLIIHGFFLVCIWKTNNVHSCRQWHKMPSLVHIHLLILKTCGISTLHRLIHVCVMATSCHFLQRLYLMHMILECLCNLVCFGVMIVGITNFASNLCSKPFQCQFTYECLFSTHLLHLGE